MTLFTAIDFSLRWWYVGGEGGGGVGRDCLFTFFHCLSGIQGKQILPKVGEMPAELTALIQHLPTTVKSHEDS